MTRPDLTTSLCILNETNKPCMYYICRKYKERIVYVNRFLRRRYGNLTTNSYNYLIDYGFVCNNGRYILRNPSKVRYPNGTIKYWQGKKSFTYEDILTYINKEGDDKLC